MTHPALSEQSLSRLRGVSALCTADLDDEQLATILALAERFAALDAAGVRTTWLTGELAYAMFFDQSTRTKSAWSGAAARLGMAPVIVDGASTQIAHGETVVETGAMLGMNSHALGVRHDLILGEGQTFLRDTHRGIAEYLAARGETRTVPVVNLQCDVDHPTQTLADALWLRSFFPDGVKGKRVAVTWAYSPSYAKPLSVPQGLITLLPRLGADVVLAHPHGYPLLDECLTQAQDGARAGGGSFSVASSMNEAFEGAHVVYPKSWGPMALMRERVTANQARDTAALADIERRALAQNAAHTDWICDEGRMSLTHQGDALYMHCLPADIGAEVSPEVMDKHRFHVAEQAQGKVYVIMALLAAAKIPDLAARLQDAGST